QRRDLVVPEPAALAVACVEGGQAPVVGADEHHAKPDQRSGNDLIADLRGPALLAGGGIQRDHLAIKAAHDHQAVAHARPATQAKLARVMPGLLPVAQVEGAYAATHGGGEHATIGDRRHLADAKPALALAGAGGPEPLNARAGGEVNQWSGSGLFLLVAGEPATHGAATAHGDDAAGDERSLQQAVAVERRADSGCGNGVHQELASASTSEGTPPTWVSLSSMMLRRGDRGSRSCSAAPYASRAPSASPMA